MKNRHEEEDEDEKPELNWPMVRDLFSGVIEPAKDWPDADLIESLQGMAGKFAQAFPGVEFNFEDMKLALYDMRVNFERNEHNNKFYYLAKWR